MGREKIRILPMKSRTFLTNWEMEDDPFTSSTNNAVALKLKRKNFKLLLKKLKLPLNKKRTRFLEHNLSLVKSVKRLTERSMRRKKSLTTPAKITNAPWTLCKLPWKPNLVPRPKLSASRRNWNLTSTSSKSHWTTPTRLMPKLTNPSSGTKHNSVTPKDSWNQKPAKSWKSPKKLDWLNVKLMPCKESWKNLELFSIPLTAARSKPTWNLPKQDLLSMT